MSHSIGPVVVIPHERVEGAQLHPSYAQLLSGVASEAADVSAGERHPGQAELQHGWEEGQKCLLCWWNVDRERCEIIEKQTEKGHTPGME